jgi:Tol biopolymer transport system component
MHRSVRLWRWLPLAALGILIPMGAGCDITPEQEEEFKLTGVLSQATLDTTTTDHVRPTVAPDGTRILFITDAYAADKNQTAANDYALVTMPAPGSVPDLVTGFARNPGWTRVNLGQLPNDTGVLYNPFESLKGEAAWTEDSQHFVAVIHNDDGNERMYRLQLGPDNGNGQISLIDRELIDDVDYASVGNRNSYHYLSPSVSPDGQWLAYARYYFRAGNVASGIPVDAEYMAVFAYNFATQQVVRVTNGSTLEQDPSWSPSGTQIVFTAQAGEVGTRDLMRVNFDPTQDADIRDWVPWVDNGQKAPFTDGRVRLTTTAAVVDWKLPVGSFDPIWMRDGRIVFTSTRRAPGVSERLRNIWMMNAEGGDPQLVIFTRSDDSEPATANFTTASSDAASLVVYTTRSNRSADFVDQKQDLWVVRGF